MGAAKLDDDLQHYTLQQCAEMSGFSLKSIIRFAANGTLKSKKIVRRRLVSRRSYLEFMEISQVENVSPKHLRKRA
jgi:hypothetical protein